MKIPRVPSQVTGTFHLACKGIKAKGFQGIKGLLFLKSLLGCDYMVEWIISPLQ